ncbi:hypothetical protein EON83_10840 [bacterium]|nr:MAG: hypothetical protein EON83_10840 [bacterium]
MQTRIDQKLDQAPPKRSTILPSARDLQAFNLVDASGSLYKAPRQIRCPGCAQRHGNDGPVLCVLFTDTSNSTVLCYYHSKGNGTGRFLLMALAKGMKARVVCDHGHGCDIGN